MAESTSKEIGSMSTTVPLSREAAGSGAEPDLDGAIAELHAGAARWSQLSAMDRSRLLAAVHAAIPAHAERWVRAACAAKGLDPSSPLAGEEWTSGPYGLLEGSAALARSLAAIAAGRSPVDGHRVGTAPGGRVAVRVLPADARQAVLLHGFAAEVWMPPGVTSERVRAEAGLGALRVRENGGVGLVLGAGNVTSIAPLDALYELVAHNRAVIVKLNPTLASLLDVYRAVLAPLIEADVVRVVAGDGAVGAYLSAHPGIDHVHITGSAATHDAIVWGTGEEGARRRAAGEPLLATPITSELGGVSPVIVVPGRWSRRDLRFQAEHVATMRLHNAGHNCIAAQVVIVSADWPQKEAFLAELRAVLDALPSRAPWYPGAQERVDRIVAAHPGAEVHGDNVLLPTADADACESEYFAPVLGVVELAGTGERFLERAVSFANAELTGTLGANIVVQPRDRRAMGAAFDEALAELRYGTIAVNAWTAVGFLTAGAPWGAFPGGTLDDVGSGIGVVHNALLLDGPERTVVTGPFRPFPRSVLHGEWSLFPKPPWFVTARSAAQTGEALTRYAAKPSWVRLPAVFLAAFRA